MKYWTYGEIRDKVRRDLGIEQETFVTPEELLGYVNAGIDEAEAEIHTIYEDYFLTKATLSALKGDETLDIPENIYGLKIRNLVYNDGVDVYQIKRFKNTQDFFEKLEYGGLVEDDIYRYVIMNDNADSLPKIHLVPSAKRDMANYFKLYYLRNANRMVDETSVCDIPEFVSFVIQYAKARCYEKEGDPRTGLATTQVDHFRKQMINTLTNMTPDGENEIEKDLSIYDDMAVEGLDYTI